MHEHSPSDMLTDSTQPGFQERDIDWINDPFHWIEDSDPLAVVQRHKDDAEEALSKGDHEDAILALAQTASALLQLHGHRALSIMSDLHRRGLSWVSVQSIPSTNVDLGMSARTVNRCSVICIILLYTRMKRINLQKCMERGE